MARTVEMNTKGPGVQIVPAGQQVIVKLDFAGGPGSNGAVDGEKYLLVCSDPTVVFDKTEYIVVGDADQSCEFKAPAGIGKVDILVALEGTPATGGNTPIASFTAMRQGTPAAVPSGTPATPPATGVTVAANGWLGIGAAVALISLLFVFVIGAPVVIGSVLGYIGMTREKPTSISDVVLGGDDVSVKGLDLTVGLKADELSKTDGVGQQALLENLKTIWAEAIVPKCTDGSTPDPTTKLCTDGSKPIP